MKRKTAPLFFLLIASCFFVSGCAHYKKAGERQNNNEWMQLFNGKDLNDWIVKIHHHEVGVNFGNT
ncbi:MAG TPA: hypothetical protein VEV15_13135, partial [Flavisolibacter sp.]|nr:hypothetical protein [Flavisolibacter sp.]